MPSITRTTLSNLYHNSESQPMRAKQNGHVAASRSLLIKTADPGLLQIFLLLSPFFSFSFLLLLPAGRSQLRRLESSSPLTPRGQRLYHTDGQTVNSK